MVYQNEKIRPHFHGAYELSICPCNLSHPFPYHAVYTKRFAYDHIKHYMYHFCYEYNMIYMYLFYVQMIIVCPYLALQQSIIEV